MPRPDTDKIILKSPIIDIAAGANFNSFYATKPMSVSRIMVLMSTTQTVAAANITFKHWYAAANVVPSSKLTLGVINIPIGTAAGTGRYMESTEFPMGVPYDIMPGEIILAISDGGGTAGAGIFAIEVEERDWQDVRFVRRQGALTTPNDAALATTLAKATAVTS